MKVGEDHQFEKAWADLRAIDSQFNSQIVLDGLVYGFTSRRGRETGFRCVEMATGKLRWNFSSDLDRGQFLAVDGHFVILGEHGHLAALMIDPHEARVVSMTSEPLLERPCYTAPAIYDGRLYLRNEAVLVCHDLRAP